MSEAEPQVTNEQIEIMPEEIVELDSLHATANLNLTKIEVKSTEEGEEEVLSERAALYRFSEEDVDWKERARGDIKVFKSKSSGKYRLVLRAEKTLKVRLNQYVGDVALKPNSGSDKAWNWRWQDYATDSGLPEVHSFAVRFRTKEIAESFNAVWEKARQEQRCWCCRR
jgi:Ran-binding protein 1